MCIGGVTSLTGVRHDTPQTRAVGARSQLNAPTLTVRPLIAGWAKLTGRTRSPRAVASGILKVGRVVLPCAVLETMTDGRQSSVRARA